jgi:hypothetical protein
MSDNPYRRGEDGRYPPHPPINPDDYRYRHVDPDGTMHLWNDPAGDHHPTIVQPDGTFGTWSGSQLMWSEPDGYPVQQPVSLDPDGSAHGGGLPAWEFHRQAALLRADEYRRQEAAFSAAWNPPAPPPAQARPRGRGLLGWLGRR